MSFLTSNSFVCGNVGASSEADITSARVSRERPMPALTLNPLERLVQLMQANDRLMDELATSRERVARARAYQDEPGCNARFGAAHLDRCRAKHSGILVQLRANRLEALGLLGRSGSAL